MTGSRIVLLGLMGSGKSTVSAELGRQLGWPVHDSDLDIEAGTGRTVAELDAALGAVEMHSFEAAHLLEHLQRPGPSIICAAASVIDDERCRAALRAPGVIPIWLRAGLATLVPRFESRGHRPTFGARPAELLASQIAVRHDRYSSIDPMIIDVDNLTPGAVAGLIVRSVRFSSAAVTG